MLKNIFKNRNLLTILISIFIFGIIFIFSYLGFFYGLNKNLQGFFHELKIYVLGSNVSNELIIVEIDEKSLKQLGSFPFDRKVYKPFISNLNQKGAAVIAFDIIFEDFTNPESDIEFSEAIKEAKNIIFGLSLGDLKVLNLPLEKFNRYALSKGYLRPNLDKRTNVVYSIIPYSIFGGTIYEHFSISILKSYYSFIYNTNFHNSFFGIKNNKYYLTPDSNLLTPSIIDIPLANKNKNDYLVGNNSEPEILINYIDRNKFKRVSFVDIYDKDKFEEISKEIDFKDKIVIVGTTAKGIKDIFTTPLGIEYGVYVHANMINTELTKSFLLYFDKNIEWIIIFLLVIVSVYFNLSKSGTILIFSNGAIIFLFLIAFPIIVLAFTSLVINYTIELIFALIFSLAFSNIAKYLIENRHKLKLNKALSEYVSHDIAQEIMYELGKVNLNGEEKKIAIFFSDIKGFTSISEKLTPKTLVSFLREYLTKMSDIIIEHKGFINKYEGDSIMALWGVFGKNDNMCLSACYSALRQINLLKNLNKQWEEQGYDKIEIRIGLHVGNAIIGNIGSEGKKLEFTALGDSVNLASRLEGVNKFYQTEICVSHDIFFETKDIFGYRFLDTIKVKGKDIGVKIYELIGEKEKLNDMQKDIITKFENAVNLYLEKKFKEALQIFERLAQFGDKPSQTYIYRCKQFIKNPPESDWDGIWTMKSK